MNPLAKEKYDVSELNYLTATEVLARFRDRSLSPVEYLDALVTRIDQTEPMINAVAERLFEEANDDAQRASQVYATRPEDARPLEGLPVAAKEEHPIAGRTFSEGSLAYADRISDVTHPIIQRIRGAGGIVHIRTKTPEFSCAPYTHSRMWGVTRNPWNLAYSSGGSSGGSAAALASGTTPLATGSDIGGSIRIPSAFSGVVGYKPPYGRVPALAPNNLDAYRHDGPLARSVADCGLLENIISGPLSHDVVSLRPGMVIPSDLGNVEGFRVAYCPNLGDWYVHPDVEANTRSVAEALRDAGALVEEVEPGLRYDDVLRASEIHISAIFGVNIRKADDEYGDLLSSYAREFAIDVRQCNVQELIKQGLELEAQIYEKVGPLFEKYDALVCPTSGVPALIAGEDYRNGQNSPEEPFANPHHAIMTIPFNILSRCPVLAVPSGWAASGVPTGVQIVGRTYDEISVFQVGACLETRHFWDYQHGRTPTFEGARADQLVAL
jgi:aspartyl-tRNA(Asn)/glutamyl-tRNA(Gln) amidotransferase subunit A